MNSRHLEYSVTLTHAGTKAMPERTDGLVIAWLQASVRYDSYIKLWKPTVSVSRETARPKHIVYRYIEPMNAEGDAIYFENPAKAVAWCEKVIARIADGADPRKLPGYTGQEADEKDAAKDAEYLAQQALEAAAAVAAEAEAVAS
jgi:hypothetical protein